MWARGLADSIDGFDHLNSPSYINAVTSEIPMRPEVERNVEEIQQAVALLRRHL